MLYTEYNMPTFIPHQLIIEVYTVASLSRIAWSPALTA